MTAFNIEGFWQRIVRYVAEQIALAIAAAVALIEAPWQTYTPTLGGTGWAVGNGTVIGRYKRVGLGGHDMKVQVKLTFGSTTTAGSARLTMTLPSGHGAVAGGIRAIGNAFYLNDAGPIYTGVVLVASGGTVMDFYSVVSSIGQIGSLVQTAPFTFANTDTIEAQVVYERA